jgi:ankyrin repeat protein
MKPNRICKYILFLLVSQSFAQSKHESFFPEGFTPPKCAAGGGTAVVVGPTPYFVKRESNSATGAQVHSSADPTTKATLDRINHSNGNSELMIAAVTGAFDTVNTLLLQGAEINAVNKAGSTALMGAAAGGFLNIIATLLENGADVNLQSKDRSTALIFAAKNGHLEVVNLLLQNNSNAKLKDRSGRTAAMLAAEQGYSEIADLLKKESEKKR